MSSPYHLLEPYYLDTIIVLPAAKACVTISDNNKVIPHCNRYHAPARIRSLNSLPTLKKGLFLGKTVTSIPVLGFLPE